MRRGGRLVGVVRGESTIGFGEGTAEEDRGSMGLRRGCSSWGLPR